MAEHIVDYEVDEDNFACPVEHEFEDRLTGSSWPKYRDCSGQNTPDNNTTNTETSLVDSEIPTQDNEKLTRIGCFLEKKGLTWHSIEQARRNARLNGHRHATTHSTIATASSLILSEEEGTRHPLSSIGKQRVAMGNAPWVREDGVPRVIEEGKQGHVKVKDREGVTGVAVRSGRVTVYNENWDKMSKRQKIRHRRRVNRQAREQLRNVHGG